jgi:hypothetical protein
MRLVQIKNNFIQKEVDNLMMIGFMLVRPQEASTSMNNM